MWIKMMRQGVICGRVVDVTKQTLPGASVYIEALKMGVMTLWLFSLNKRGCLCRMMEAALLLFFSVGSVLIQFACSRWIGRIRGRSFRSCRAQGCGGCPADSSGSSLPGC